MNKENINKVWKGCSLCIDMEEKTIQDQTRNFLGYQGYSVQTKKELMDSFIKETQKHKEFGCEVIQRKTEIFNDWFKNNNGY